VGLVVPWNALACFAPGWFVDIDFRLAPQHLGNGDFGRPRSGPETRNIFDRSTKWVGRPISYMT
jgi:hypothetical protein